MSVVPQGGKEQLWVSGEKEQLRPSGQGAREASSGMVVVACTTEQWRVAATGWDGRGRDGGGNGVRSANHTIGFFEWASWANICSWVSLVYVFSQLTKAQDQIDLAKFGQLKQDQNQRPNCSILDFFSVLFCGYFGFQLICPLLRCGVHTVTGCWDPELKINHEIIVSTHTLSTTMLASYLSIRLVQTTDTTFDVQLLFITFIKQNLTSYFS